MSDRENIGRLHLEFSSLGTKTHVFKCYRKMLRLLNQYYDILLLGGHIGGHIAFCGCHVIYINLQIHAPFYFAQNAFYRMSISLTVLKPKSINGVCVKQRHFYCLGVFYPPPSLPVYVAKKVHENPSATLENVCWLLAEIQVGVKP